MTSLSIDQLYEQQIKALPRADRLWLLARIASDLAATEERPQATLDLLHQTPGERIFHCAAEVAAQRAEERDAWDG